MTEKLCSALFSGLVTHARLRPRQHRLAYRVSSLLLDLDELEVLNRRLRWFSVDRFNLFSFYTKDRSDGSGGWFDHRHSVVLHVVRKHHYGFAIVSDIHKANTIKRPVQKLDNGSLRDRDRSIPGIPLGNSHGGTG